MTIRMTEGRFETVKDLRLLDDNQLKLLRQMVKEEFADRASDMRRSLSIGDEVTFEITFPARVVTGIVRKINTKNVVVDETGGRTMTWTVHPTFLTRM